LYSPYSISSLLVSPDLGQLSAYIDIPPLLVAPSQAGRKGRVMSNTGGLLLVQWRLSLQEVNTAEAGVGFR
jgi:hypothetical protein